MTTSRGFKGRPRAKADGERVPPGQYVTEDFPVLSAGPTPRIPGDTSRMVPVAGPIKEAYPLHSINVPALDLGCPDEPLSIDSFVDVAPEPSGCVARERRDRTRRKPPSKFAET
jgi:hypothetical protein